MPCEERCRHRLAIGSGDLGRLTDQRHARERERVIRTTLVHEKRAAGRRLEVLRVLGERADEQNRRPLVQPVDDHRTIGMAVELGVLGGEHPHVHPLNQRASVLRVRRTRNVVGVQRLLAGRV